LAGSNGLTKITKNGTGTLTLSGANTYTGDTDVNAGALSLLGTVASPNINVAGGAALVLSTAPIGAITNNLVFSSGAKVRVNGTPSGSSVTLLTTSGAISGVPELEANVPGYMLVTSGSTISLQAAEDTVAPLITLRGPNPMTIALGETFTDPGADVADNLDADRLIYGTGMVDGNQAGSYSVTYDASDAAAKAPTPVVRTVNVAKGTPVLSGISASAITEGQSFGDSTITGTAQYNGAEVEGTWAFAGGQTLNGSGTYNVVFYPTDTSNYNSNPGTVSLTVNPAGVSFASWSSGGTTNSELVGKYAIGGASNSAATGEKPVVTLDGNKLSLSAIVRTNDAKLNVVGEAGSGLTNWSTNGVTSTAAGSQAGVSAGCERRVFSVDRTNSPSRQFLRLKATLQP
jgi:autotransporter-associated beta strand protein